MAATAAPPRHHHHLAYEVNRILRLSINTHTSRLLIFPSDDDYIYTSVLYRRHYITTLFSITTLILLASISLDERYASFQNKNATTSHRLLYRSNAYLLASLYMTAPGATIGFSMNAFELMIRRVS